MDFGGLNWMLITIVGAVVLGVVIFLARARNRTPPERADDTEAATRRLYEEEEREHHGEADIVP